MGTATACSLRAVLLALAQHVCSIDGAGCTWTVSRCPGAQMLRRGLRSLKQFYCVAAEVRAATCLHHQTCLACLVQ